MADRSAVARSPKVPEIRKGDTVVVLAGKDAGKRGVVEKVIRRQPAPRGRSMFRRGSTAGGVSLVVEGLNIAKRHTKPRQSSSATDRMPKIQQGGILEIAQPMPMAKVMVVCSSCAKPTRIAHKPMLEPILTSQALFMRLNSKCALRN